MSSFDTIRGKCPFCGQSYESQTELGDRRLEIWQVGDKTSLADMALRLKSQCHSCKNYPVALIKGGVLVALREQDASLIEKAFGATIKGAPGRKL